MAVSISFSSPGTSTKTSDFSDAEFGAEAIRLLNGLVKVKSYLRQHHRYMADLMANGDANERYGTVHYGSLFGADDVLEYHHEYGTSSRTFKAWWEALQLADNFYGTSYNAAYTEFPSNYHSDKYPSSVKDFTAAHITLDMDFWSYRVDANSNDYTAKDYPKNSIFWDIGGTSTLNRRVYANKVFNTLYYLQQQVNVLRSIVANAPTHQGGIGIGEDSYQDFPSIATGLYFLQPAPLARLRQALAWLRETQDENDYYDDENGFFSAPDHISDYYFAEYDPDYGFDWTEITDYTKDYGVYYSSSDCVPIYDPLSVQGIGYVGMKNTDGGNSLVFGVELARNMIIPSYAVATDYKEETNPQTYRASYGKANYLQSNVRQWANYQGSSPSGWKIAQHDYDAFFSTNSYPYHECMSGITRANIAATVHATYLPNDTGAITNNTSTTGRTLTAIEDRVWLPLLKNFGVTNTFAARAWTNFQLDIDPDLSQLSGLSGKNSSAYAENDWSWQTNATYRRQIKLNPNSKSTRIASATYLYVPTRGAGTKSGTSGDATIATHTACYYLSAADGTATKDQVGGQAPYSYTGWLFGMTIVPYHAWKYQTNVSRDKCSGLANLPYTAAT